MNAIEAALALKVREIEAEEERNRIDAERAAYEREAARRRTVEKGDLGDTGPEGKQGPQGDQGPQGPEGKRGDNGTDGVNGKRGQRGETGPAGTPGPQGEPGPQGPKGDKGDKGDTGETGAGFNWRGVWDSVTRYQTGDVVSYDGSSWLARGATHGAPPSSGPWNIVARRGENGATGFSLGGGGASSAEDIEVTPAGNLGSEDVQAALEELQGDIDGVQSDLLDLAGDVTTLEASSHAALTLGTANGLSLVGQALSLANVVAAGSSGAMTGADKTKLDAITGTHTGTNTGDVTIGTANGLSLVGQALSLATAVAGGANGALLGTDKTKIDNTSGTNSGDVTIGTANGLSLVGQGLSLAAAGATAGAMSAADKTKLDAITGSHTGTNTGDVTIGTANGLSLVGQAISLANVVAAGASGAMTGSDKTKLDAITGTHTGSNSGDVTLTAIGSTPNANGASLSGQALNLQPASESFGGVVDTNAQSIAGNKTLKASALLDSQGHVLTSTTRFLFRLKETANGDAVTDAVGSLGTLTVVSTAPTVSTALEPKFTNARLFSAGYYSGTSQISALVTKIKAQTWTLGMWVRPTSVATDQTIFTVGESDRSTSVLHVRMMGATGSAQIYVGNSDVSQNTAGATPLTASDWFHVAISRSGGAFSLYVNGALQGSPFTISTSAVTPVTPTLFIGNGYGSVNFAGRIADVWFEDRVLSAAEVLTEYNYGNQLYVNGWLTTTGPVRILNSTSASSVPALQLAAGARLSLGGGTSDYMTSDGASAITCRGNFLAGIGTLGIAGTKWSAFLSTVKDGSSRARLDFTDSVGTTYLDGNTPANFTGVCHDFGTNRTFSSALMRVWRVKTGINSVADTEVAYIQKDGTFWAFDVTNKAAEVPTPLSGTGITVAYNGALRAGSYKITIDKAATIAAALTQDFALGVLPAKARVTSVICDTTQAFAHGANTFTMRVGKTAGGQEYILDHDVKTATVTKGLVDGDMGASLTRAAAVQGGDIPSWSATTTLYARLTKVGANIGTGASTSQTAGSVTIYFTVESL